MGYIFSLTEEKNSQQYLVQYGKGSRVESGSDSVSYNLEQIIIILWVLSFYDVKNQVQWMTVTM